MKGKFRCLLFAWVLILYGFQVANACTCVGYSSPCGEYSSADAVVVAKIESISEGSSKAVNLYPPGQKVKLVIERSYKGTDAKTITLSQPNTTCNRQFAQSDKGKTFLLYLDRDKGTNEYTIIVCGRSGEVETKTDDLSWLNALPGSLKRTRFSGVLSHYVNNPQFTFIDYLAGVKVRIFNERESFYVITDKNGLYEVWDLPPGGYKVEPDFPKSYKVYFDMKSGWTNQEEDGVKYDPSVSFVGRNACAVADYILIDAPK